MEDYSVIIDFTKKEETLTESWMAQFGAWNKLLLKKMYGQDVKMYAKLPGFGDFAKMLEGEEGVPSEDTSLKYVVRGEKKDLTVYADALFAEKNYLDQYLHYGDGHMQTEKARELLRQAVSKFETQTGITWPFTDEG